MLPRSGVLGCLESAVLSTWSYNGPVVQVRIQNVETPGARHGVPLRSAPVGAAGKEHTPKMRQGRSSRTAAPQLPAGLLEQHRVDAIP